MHTIIRRAESTLLDKHRRHYLSICSPSVRHSYLRAEGHFPRVLEYNNVCVGGIVRGLLRCTLCEGHYFIWQVYCGMSVQLATAMRQASRQEVINDI